MKKLLQVVKYHYEWNSQLLEIERRYGENKSDAKTNPIRFPILPPNLFAGIDRPLYPNVPSQDHKAKAQAKPSTSKKGEGRKKKIVEDEDSGEEELATHLGGMELPTGHFTFLGNIS